MKFEQSINLKESVVLINYLQRWKVLAPQILAVIAIGSFNIFSGRCVALGDVLVRRTQDYAVVGSFTFVALVSGFVSGIATDTLGRLTTIKLALLPGVVGSAMAATVDNNLPVMVLSTALTAMSLSFLSTASVVYISDVSRKEYRGALVALLPLFLSLGIVTVYIETWFFTLRTTSWVSLFYLAIPTLSLRFIHESPIWLVSKRRTDEARSSSKWFDQFLLLSEEKVATLVEFEIEALEEESSGANAAKISRYMVFWKPFVIITGILIFQQFSGTIVVASDLIGILKKIDNGIDSRALTIYITLFKLVIFACTVYLMKRMNRRGILLCTSTCLMAFTSLSGMYTQVFYKDTVVDRGVILALTLIRFSLALVSSVTVFVMTAEIFPLDFKGIGYGMVSVGTTATYFAAYQFYSLLHFLDGINYHVQYLCALFLILNIVLIYVFLPETHCRKFSDIVQYFSSHSVYFTASKTHTYPVKLLNE